MTRLRKGGGGMGRGEEERDLRYKLSIVNEVVGFGNGVMRGWWYE